MVAAIGTAEKKNKICFYMVFIKQKRYTILSKLDIFFLKIIVQKLNRLL